METRPLGGTHLSRKQPCVRTSLKNRACVRRDEAAKQTHTSAECIKHRGNTCKIDPLSIHCEGTALCTYYSHCDCQNEKRDNYQKLSEHEHVSKTCALDSLAAYRSQDCWASCANNAGSAGGENSHLPLKKCLRTHGPGYHYQCLT